MHAEPPAVSARAFRVTRAPQNGDAGPRATASPHGGPEHTVRNGMT
jgi:hypothetical protein